MPSDFALRLVGGFFPDIAKRPVYPSTAAEPINPAIDVMCQNRKLDMRSASGQPSI
jgi:hypothetical protein